MARPTIPLSKDHNRGRSDEPFVVKDPAKEITISDLMKMVRPPDEYDSGQGYGPASNIGIK